MSYSNSSYFQFASKYFLSVKTYYFTTTIMPHSSKAKFPNLSHFADRQGGEGMIPYAW